MSLVQSIGLFWNEADVFWGRGSQPGAIYGLPANNVTADPIDFREQVGVYVLYADYDLIYVGQTGSGKSKLLNRLKQHRTDDLAGRWNKFSWFGLRRVLASGELSNVNQAAHPELADVLNHIEAILIHAVEPPLNRQGGRFGEVVTRYLQWRDDRLPPTLEQMVLDIHRKVVDDT
ncbi:GIY-YIG nuclease family protein [Maioricimonas sp. JC845]|uniref:GIY-YIG nuclease family protein n=1 Tax=Maioricimonas sp. JC845 TaxID=3232138 RepID=UPI003458D02B